MNTHYQFFTVEFSGHIIVARVLLLELPMNASPSVTGVDRHLLASAITVFVGGYDAIFRSVSWS